MVFVKRLGRQTWNGRTVEFWFWSDEEKLIACYATKAELSILFHKRFSKEIEGLMKFCMARDLWQSFRVSANENVIVMAEA